MRPETEIEMVRRHVAEGEGHVRKQTLLIARMIDHGLDAGTAEELLVAFERTLALHRDHLARISKVTSPSPQDAP